MHVEDLLITTTEMLILARQYYLVCRCIKNGAGVENRVSVPIGTLALARTSLLYLLGNCRI